MSGMNKGYWQENEHRKFLEALFLYGTKWKEVQRHIKSRDVKQVKSHAQKYFKSLRLSFLREVKRNNDSINEDYFNQWVIKYLRETFYPLIETILFDFSDDSKKKLSRLAKVLLRKVGTHFPRQKILDIRKKCSCRRLGNKICDCHFKCCNEEKVNNDDQMQFFSNLKEKNQPIFVIEKVKRNKIQDTPLEIEYYKLNVDPTIENNLQEKKSEIYKNLENSENQINFSFDDVVSLKGLFDNLYTFDQSPSCSEGIFPLYSEQYDIFKTNKNKTNNSAMKDFNDASSFLLKDDFLFNFDQ